MIKPVESCFDPVEFYHLAHKLFESDKNNIALVRTCVGRVYYAAHLAAREKAKISDTGVGVHRAVIDYYSKKNGVVGNRLKSLLKLRHLADYELNKNITKKDFISAQQQSEIILVALGRIQAR